MLRKFSGSSRGRRRRDRSLGLVRGWPDKVAQVAGGANAVAGPYFNFSVPEPTGVVAVVAPADSSLLGLVLIGSGFLMLTDLVSRTIISPIELPIGVITALIGAPVFAAILLGRKRAERRR